MIPERQAMMAGLPVAAVSAALYLVLVAAHLLSQSPITYALVLGILMSGWAWTIALMFSPARADIENVCWTPVSGSGMSVLAEMEVELLSADEEERLISQLEDELEVLEKRYRRELTAMQDAARNNAGPPDEWRRS